MDTRQIMCCLRYVSSFLGVFPSYLLPQHSIAQSGTLIVNTDPHTETGSHWLAVHFQLCSHSSYYFDSYGLPPFIPSIQSFIRRNCSVWDYNSVQLQVPTSAVCGKYCCLFALYMDRLYAETIRRSTCYSNRRQGGFRNVRVGSLGLYAVSRGGQCSKSRRNK